LQRILKKIDEEEKVVVEILVSSCRPSRSLPVTWLPGTLFLRGRPGSAAQRSGSEGPQSGEESAGLNAGLATGHR
jgi:hypothetical protein